MYFSISAPQQVTLPNGDVLSFRVNAQDSSLCELHMVGVDGNDQAGTHILTFKRNGLPQDTAFAATVVAPGQPGYVDAPSGRNPDGTPYRSVNDDAVRAGDRQSASAPADFQGLTDRGPLTPAQVEANRQAERAGNPLPHPANPNDPAQGIPRNRGPGNVNTTQTFQTTGQNPIPNPRP